ncbi:hypothetical protein AAG565_05635 [Fontimonas sp. SYSU GA230001]|uniref:hypothetical protein n=1 Tax=Fontimonas sp. SYSU GA230001 TaxID=3142450 RepID=UPI0032B31368
MKHRVILATGTALALLLGACSGRDAAPTAVPVETPNPGVVAQELQADIAAAANACTQDCGDGVIAAIQCAPTETPVCDCAAQPQARCAPGAVPAP